MKWYQKIDNWADRKAEEYSDIPGWLGLAIVVIMLVLL